MFEQLTVTTLVGTVAAIASTASFTPQAWRIIRSRDVKGLSRAMYALTVFGFACWLTYGVLKGDWALIVPNAICLSFAIFIFTMIMLPKPQREHVADAIETAAGTDNQTATSASSS